MAVAGFRFEACTVAVACRDPGILRWLAGFLACGFEEGCPAEADHVVELAVDAGDYRRLLRAGPRPGSVPVAGFAGDSGPRRVRPWRGAGSAGLFRDERSPVFYAVADGGARVTLVAAEACRKVRTALMRVVRELVMARVVATGGTLVHGAAVHADGGVVVMCGPRRSGKTTLLVSVLRVPGVRYVANDRCVVRADADGASVRGLPTLVSIRDDMMGRFPDLRAGLARLRAERVRPQERGRSRFSVTPPELCALLGAEVSAGGPLRALVFPRVARGAAGLVPRRLDRAEAGERLARALFRAGDDRILGDVFASGAGEPARGDRLASVAPALAQVPCFECALGGGAAAPAAAAAMLARLAADPAPAREARRHA